MDELRQLILSDHPLLQYAGNFHVVLLHLPIGIFVGLLLLEFIKLFIRDHKGLDRACNGLWLFLLFFTWLTAYLGFQLAAQGEYDEVLLADHERWGVYTAIAFSLIWFLHWLYVMMEAKLLLRLYHLSLLAGLVVLCVAGHYGGSLTHGKNFLQFKEKSYSSFDQKSVSPPEQKSDEPLANKMSMNEMDNDPSEPLALLSVPDEITALFRKRCYECHGPNKVKGQYRMDLLPDLFLGGESKLTAIAPGDVEKSELARRILLPRSDDEAMPPDGKRGFTAEETEQIIQWIAHIETGSGMSMMSMSSSIAPAQSTPKGPRVQVQFLPEQNERLERLTHELSDLGVKVEPTLWKTGGYYVNLSYLSAENRKAALGKLADFTEEIVWLELNRREIDSEEWRFIERLRNLQRLNLRATNTDDGNLRAISRLSNLEFLHLGETRVTDRGIKLLNTLRKLETLHQ